MQMAKLMALGIGLKDRKENFVLTLGPSQLKSGVCFYLFSLPNNIALESFFCVNFLSSKKQPRIFFQAFVIFYLEKYFCELVRIC